MLLVELQNRDVLETLPTVDGIDPSDAGEQSGYLRIGEWVALPVTHVACRIDGRIDPEILDETGVSLGTLCLTAKLGGIEPGALTKWQYVAYLADVEVARAGNSHSFIRNYVVIKSIYLDEYLAKFFHSAPVWGGFSHSAAVVTVSRGHETVVARTGINFPTRFHDMAFSRYISANNAFERFLRLYHSLELIFDFIIMKSIQKMDDDMTGFGAISRAYGRSELDRLKYILSECCEDWESIAATFMPVATFELRAIAIFQDYTKDGNPLTAQKWESLIDACRAGQTSNSDFVAAKICEKHLPYNRLVSSIASYWIYRVRSSIAHSRVSEFLFEDSDEEFIIDFAEGILLEVVRQVFSSNKLRELMA